MKFSETAQAKTINIVGFPTVFIYYLLKNDEVVYVGQTRQGLLRPFCHIRDKDFDEVKIIECKKEELDSKEAEAISKYTPKYNKTMIDDYSIDYFKRMLKARYNRLYREVYIKHILLDKMNIKSKYTVFSTQDIYEIAKAFGITITTHHNHHSIEYIPKIQAMQIIEKLDYLLWENNFYYTNTVRANGVT